MSGLVLGQIDVHSNLRAVPNHRQLNRSNKISFIASATPMRRMSSTAASAAGGAAGVAAVATKSAATTSSHDVPATWSEANSVFLSHPSAAVPVIGIGLLLAARASQQPITVLDAAVGASAVAFWLVQEWVVHKHLLHSKFEWPGKTIHKQHHEQPYHHVSLDPPALVLGVMLLASAVFAALLGPGSPLWLTATATYWAAGLGYEWLHYIVHTRWVPPAGWRGKWLRAVRRHHMLHHMRNENYWLSFSAPQVDALFGTLPARSTSVPLTEMARIAHGSAAAAAPKHDGSSKAAAPVAQVHQGQTQLAGQDRSSSGAAAVVVAGAAAGALASTAQRR